MKNSANRAGPRPRTMSSNGGALRRGNPGNKGGGRPTNEYRKRMAKLLNRRAKTKGGKRSKTEFAIDKYLGECLDGEHGPSAFFQALDRVSDRAVGKVPNVTQAAGADEPLIIRVVMDHGAMAHLQRSSERG